MSTYGSNDSSAEFFSKSFQLLPDHHRNCNHFSRLFSFRVVSVNIPLFSAQTFTGIKCNIILDYIFTSRVITFFRVYDAPFHSFPFEWEFLPEPKIKYCSLIALFNSQKKLEL